MKYEREKKKTTKNNLQILSEIEKLLEILLS